MLIVYRLYNKKQFIIIIIKFTNLYTIIVYGMLIIISTKYTLIIYII